MGTLLSCFRAVAMCEKVATAGLLHPVNFWQCTVPQLQVQSQTCKKCFSNPKLSPTDSMSRVKATGYIADGANMP